MPRRLSRLFWQGILFWLGIAAGLVLIGWCTRVSAQGVAYPPVLIRNEGVDIGRLTRAIDFVGTSVNCVFAAGVGTCTVTGGSGSANMVEASVALTDTGFFSTTVTGQAWVTATSIIVCSPLGTTIDGLTPEAVAVGALGVSISSRVAGTGFNVDVFSPNGLTGTVRVHCTGA